MNFTDAQLERRIKDTREQFAQAQDVSQKKKYWRRLQRLIAQRSPEYVKQMEADRGLG